MGRVTTCDPDKSSKNYSKMQINIEICDLFPSQKGEGGIKYSVPPPLPKVGGTCTPCPPPNDIHAYDRLVLYQLALNVHIKPNCHRISPSWWTH